jgi:hypothetical protein
MKLQSAEPLPTLPLTVLFAGFPVFWLLGLGTMIWPLGAVVMLFYLWRSHAVTVPRGFGVWLLFLVWVTFSATQLDTVGRIIGFVFRLSLYLACTVILVYAFNLASRVGRNYFLKLLTWFFMAVVAGGYLGLLMPTLTIVTPMSYVMPQALLSNDLVREMVVLRTTQFNPDAWAYIDPRPSAPFLYTNNWGNAYSVLAPVMVTYLFTLRGTRHFVPLLALVLASFIPAFLTLNRGMFVGLGIAAVVIAIRHILNGNFKVLVGVGLVAVLAVVAVSALPVAERLDNRLESSGTNESRMTVYTETISAVAASPWFGYGAPRPTESTIVPLGTQGQVWMVLFSHGFVGLALFLGFFLLLIGKTIRNRTMFGITWNSVLIVLFVQSFYYGLLIQGLLLGMLVAAIALREGQLPDDTPPRHLPSNLSDLEALVGSTPRKAL